MLKITEALNRAAPFFSFLIGLGLSALLFHRNFATLRTLAVPLEDVESHVAKVDGKCYRYRVEDANCEIVSTS
jgi:hypothetical protein